MATNKYTRWIRNLLGVSEPLIRLGKFQAGDTQAIKRGELLELSGGNWIPLDADQAMAGIIAIANEEVKAGDRAGYYEIIVPRPGDVFEFDLAAAGNDGDGTAVYFSDSETVTVTAGTNVLGNIVGQDHYPLKQQHLADGGTADMGTTIRNKSTAQITIKAAASYYAALQT